MYRSLLKGGWTLPQIDEMDIHFYLELLEDENDESEPQGFIDQVF